MITIILLSVALIFHLVFDYHKLHGGGKIRHWLSALIVLAVSTVGGFVNMLVATQSWWQFALLSLGVHFCFFDPIWNLINHQPFFYNGDPNNPGRAFTDKIWDKVPPMAQVFFRLWVLGCTLGVYLHLDWITGKSLPY